MSLLTEVKAQLGITEDYEEFDTVILMDCNLALSALKHIGLTPVDGDDYTIDSDSEWSSLVDETNVLNLVKSYICTKVRLMFDTATMSGVTKECLQAFADEAEWRIHVCCNETGSG